MLSGGAMLSGAPTLYGAVAARMLSTLSGAATPYGEAAQVTRRNPYQ
jgi:hypothetical protein